MAERETSTSGEESEGTIINEVFGVLKDLPEGPLNALVVHDLIELQRHLSHEPGTSWDFPENVDELLNRVVRLDEATAKRRLLNEYNDQLSGGGSDPNPSA